MEVCVELFLFLKIVLCDKYFVLMGIFELIFKLKFRLVVERLSEFWFIWFI